MRNNIFCWVIIVLFVISASPVAGKMTAEKVIENMITRHEKGMEDVKDITKVTDKGVTYQKWITTNGKTIYKNRNEQEMMGKDYITIYDGVYQWRKDPVSGKVTKEKLNLNPSNFYQSLKTTKAQYSGIEKIDGHKTHILEIEDVSNMTNPTTNTKLIPAKMEGWKDVAASVKLWVDAKDWVLRKTEVNIEGVNEEGKKRTVKRTIKQKDFREVNGLFISYHIVITTGASLTPEEKQKMQKAREAMAEMQKQLDEMSPEQRKMAERFMKPKIEKLQKALRSGEITEVTEVEDVKVNTGLSDDLFDGNKLKQ